jgi:mRNA interferase RelE/StbE
MSYSLIIQPDALKALKKIPGPDRRRIGRRIESLAHDPRPAGAVKLKGPVEFYRIRAGDYRVIYRIHDDVLEVVVVRVGHRGDIYRMKK